MIVNGSIRYQKLTNYKHNQKIKNILPTEKIQTSFNIIKDYKLILIFFAIYKKNIKLSNIVDYVYKVYLVNYIYLKLQNILLVMYKWKQNLSESVYLIMKD